MDADQSQFAMLFPKVDAYRLETAAVLEDELAKSAANADEKGKDRLAGRQANAAAALLKMNRPQRVWPLLRHSADPRARSRLIHRLRPAGVDPSALLGRFDQEREASVRRALLLSLGEFPTGAIPNRQAGRVAFQVGVAAPRGFRSRHSWGRGVVLEAVAAGRIAGKVGAASGPRRRRPKQQT